MTSSYTRYLIHSDQDVSSKLSQLSNLGINKYQPGYNQTVELPDQRVFGAAWDLGFPVSFVTWAIPTCASLNPDGLGYPLFFCTEVQAVSLGEVFSNFIKRLISFPMSEMSIVKISFYLQNLIIFIERK